MIKQASTRTNQGGSILIFTIVAVVLALALVGAVLFVRHKGEVAQTKVPIMGPIAPPQAAPNNGAEGNKSEEGAKNNGPAQTSDKPESSSAPQSSSPANESSSNSPSSAAELPTTGPADVAGSVFIVALVTMASVGYIRSRRLSWQL